MITRLKIQAQDNEVTLESQFYIVKLYVTVKTSRP